VYSIDLESAQKTSFCEGLIQRALLAFLAALGFLVGGFIVRACGRRMGTGRMYSGGAAGALILRCAFLVRVSLMCLGFGLFLQLGLHGTQLNHVYVRTTCLCVWYSHCEGSAHFGWQFAVRHPLCLFLYWGVSMAITGGYALLKVHGGLI